MVLTAGILNVMQLLAGDAAGKKFTQIVVGTSNAPITGAETALQNQVAKDIQTWNNLGGGFVQFNTQLEAGDPEMVIQEIGILNEAGGLCYRQVVTPKNKVAGVTYSISYKIKIQ
jgi:hypothetical protein